MRSRLDRRPKIRTGRASKRALERSGGLKLRPYIVSAFPGFRWYTYNELVVQRLQDLVDGTLVLPDGITADKIFIHLRYQTGKSTLVQLFCAWVMTIYPGLIVGVAMHKLTLARRFSKQVRTFYRQAGGTLITTGIENWTCAGATSSEQSEFWVCSVGSSPTGMPADILIGDDLKRGERDAHHSGQFKDDKAWFVSEFSSRKRIHMHPGLKRHLQFLINTRQALGDIAAFWLWQGGFHAMILPTLYAPDEWPVGLPVGPFPAGDGSTNLPEVTVEAPNCTIEPDWREPGEGLEPEVDDLTPEAFQARRNVNGGLQSAQVTAANEQGCPRPPAGGGIFHRVWTPYVPHDPRWQWSALARAWDWAATEGGGDWTASVLMGVIGSIIEMEKRGERWVRAGTNAVLHACRGRKDAAGVVQLMAAMAILDGPTVTIALPQGQGEGKLTFAGMRNDVIRLLNEVGAPIPPFRAMPVRTSTHSDAFRSAKEQRFGQPGGFAVTARPPQWDWKDKDKAIDVPGGIVICENYEIWDEQRAKMLAGPVLDLARAAAGHLQPKECEALNICPGPGLRVMLDELHEFGGFGTADHYVDAAADVKMCVGTGGTWGSWSV